MANPEDWELTSDKILKTVNGISNDVTTLAQSASATGAQTAVQPQSASKAFQVLKYGNGTITCQTQVSQDNTNWETIRSSTASEAFTNADPYTYVRTNISAQSGDSNVIVYMTTG